MTHLDQENYLFNVMDEANYKRNCCDADTCALRPAVCTCDDVYGDYPWCPACYPDANGGRHATHP